MSEDARADVARRRVLYRLPDEDMVSARRNLSYSSASAGMLPFDLYEPPGQVRSASRPVVVLVTGYSDVGMRRIAGCAAKDMASFESWGQLLAASGMVAVAYESREPLGDARAILRHIRASAAELAVDAGRIGLWSCSGHVPTALALLMDEPGLACAALLYGYTLDLDGHDDVKRAAATFRFATAAGERTVRDLPVELPFFVGRAGRDEMPGLNDSLDRFVAEALRLNRAVTVTNHRHGPHAFDLYDDGPATRAVIGQVLAFLGTILRARPERGQPRPGTGV